jgi:hypothetical protein
MKLNYKYILILMSLVVFISCDKEDYTGYSKVDFTVPTATYSITGGSNTIVVDESSIDPEEGITFEITATIPEPLSFDTFIDISRTGGTADSSDFTASRIKINALSTSGTGTVTIFRTGDLEGDETLVLSTNTNSANVNGSEQFTFNIVNDYLNDNLIVNLAWCGDYDFDLGALGHLVGSFAEIDIDGLIYDSNFNLVNNFSGATGACPEDVQFGGMPDGLYYLIIDVYDNPLAPIGLGGSVPLEASYSQEYFIPSTPILHSLSMTTDTTGSLGVMCSIEKTGNNFVVTPF